MALVRSPVGHQTSHSFGVIFHFRDPNDLVATGQVRSEPLKCSARDPESVKESAQKNGMVDGIESGCQIKHDQHNDTTTIDCT